jgi:hypothetical protein
LPELQLTPTGDIFVCKSPKTLVLITVMKKIILSLLIGLSFLSCKKEDVVVVVQQQSLDRKLARNTIYGIANPEDGNLIILQSNYTNSGDAAATAKMTMTGVEKWFTTPNGSEKTATGSSCCSSSRPVSVQPLQHGGTLTLAQRINSTANYSNYYVIMMLPLDDAGNPK